MTTQDDIKSLTVQELFDPMRADAAEFEANPDTARTFPEYLGEAYPEVLQFVMEASEAVPFDTEEERKAFQIGGALVASAICRNADRLALPSLD